jgi:drug/metabolite transporter (DMT)-like permease
VAWYPYRVLGQAGLDGAWATLLTYGVSLVLGSAMFLGHWRDVRRAPWACLAMGLAIGWSNLAYVIGVLEGEVMRVLLLFYLAPLWTVPISRILLGERLDLPGAGVMAVALADVRDSAKSLVIWAGVSAAALLYLPFAPTAPAAALRIAGEAWAVWVPLGLALVAMGLALQYGLSRVPANRAIVILLVELAVAAAASYWLAGERLRPQDWIGGSLIVLASVASALIPTRGRCAPAPASP